MIARGAAALLLFLCLGASPLQNRWISANAHAKTFNATMLRIAQWHSAPALSGQDPHTLAIGILRNRALYHFSPVQLAPAKTWWDRFSSWMRTQWDRFWKLIFSRVRVSSGAGLVFGDLLLILSALAVVVAGVRLLSLVQFRGAPPGPPSRALPRVAGGSELYAQSCAAARRGAYADAISKLFLATLYVMDSGGAIDAEPARTVGELQRELRAADSALVPAFERIAQIFTAAVYAERPLLRDDWLRASEAYNQLKVLEPAHS